MTQTNNISLTLPSAGDPNWTSLINSNFVIIDSLFSSNVATGHTHSGVAGSGPKIDHYDLLHIGTYTHEQIDTHIDTVGIHTDTKISTVIGDKSDKSPSPPTTVTNVSSLKFTGATLTDLGSGAVLIDVYGDGERNELFTRTRSASISYTDNFNWPTGTFLSDHSWVVDVLASGAPEFVVGGSSTGASGSYAVLDLNPASSSTRLNGYCASLVNSHVPHSESQRVNVNIFEFDKLSGAFASADYVALGLDLLSATGGGSAYRPVKYGLSLIISKNSGSSTLTYTLTVKGTASGAGVRYSDFSGVSINGQTTLQGLPVEYLRGTHELSISRHPSTAGAYYIHYYYQHGLVWRRLFTQSDIIGKEIAKLITTLSQDTQPSYGRIGFSIGYALAAGSRVVVKAKSVAIGSQDDLNVVRVVDDPPSSPGNSPICDTALTYGLGDYIDFSGSGDPTNWFVSSVFYAGEEGAQQGDGFKVTQLGGIGDSYNVFCSPPSSPPDIRGDGNISSNSSGRIIVKGRNLPRSSYTTVRFLAGTASIPKDWETPSGSEFFSVDEELPSTFITATKIYANNGDVDLDGNTVIAIDYQTGNRLPWGQSVSIEITAAYDSTYTTTIPAALTIVPGEPARTGFTLLRWDNSSNPGNPGWVEVTPSDFVIEGDTIGIGLNANNLPVGTDFWQNGFTNWSAPDTGLIYVANRTNRGSTLRHSMVFGRSLSMDSMLSGKPPVTTITTNYHNFVPTITMSSLKESDSVLLVEELDVDLWQTTKNGGDAVYTELVLENPDTLPGNWVDIRIPLLKASQILPRNPLITSRSISTDASGVSASITLIGKYISSACKINPLSGFASSSPSPPNYVDNGNGTQTVTFVAPLGAAGSDVSFELINTDDEAWLSTISNAGDYGSTGKTVVDICRVRQSPGSSPPSPEYQGGSLSGVPLVEDTVTQISLVAADVYYFAIDPAQSAYFTILGSSPDLSPSPPVSAGYTKWYVDIFTKDSGDSLPSNANLRLHNGNVYTTVQVSTAAISAPSISSVGLDSVSGSTSWNISYARDIRDLYITVTNGVQNAILELDNTAGDERGLVFDKDGGRVSYGTWTHVSGNVWKIPVRLLAGTQAGDTTSLIITTPTNDTTGASLSDTLTDAITFTDKVVVGRRREGLPTGSEAYPAGEVEPTVPMPLGYTPPAQDLITLRPLERGAHFFLDPVMAGRYSEFVIPGAYTIYNPGDPTAEFEVNFYDDSGTSILEPGSSVNITGATTSQIIGSFRAAQTSAGKRVTVRVINTLASPSPSPGAGLYTTATFVGFPPPPVVTGVLGNISAASTGESLSIFGDNLVPPTAPSGQPALNYTYTLFDSGSPSPSGSPEITNISFDSTTNNQIDVSFDTSVNAGGRSVGLRIGYFNQTISFPTLTFIQNVATSPYPVISEIKYYNSQYDSQVEAGTLSPLPEVRVGPNETAILRIVGTGLHGLNVESGYFEVVGEEYDSPNYGLSETPPGPGLYPGWKTLDQNKIWSQTIVSQDDTKLKLEFGADALLANARAQIHLTRPSTHPLGSGVWDAMQLLGSPSPSPSPRAGLLYYDLTAKHGDTILGPFQHHDPTINANTQLTWARDAQSKVGPGTDGTQINVTARFESAIVSNPPSIISVPDPVFGTEMTLLSATVAPNLFDLVLTIQLPSPGSGGTFYGNSFASPALSPSGSPIASPSPGNYAAAGFRLENGQPLFSVVLGRTDWFGFPNQVSVSP